MKATTRRITTTVVILASGPMLLAGCGTKTVAGTAVAQKISESLQQKVGKRYSVGCPSKIEVKAGKTARCRINGTDGSVGVTVTMKDDKGHFNYRTDRLPKKPSKNKAKKG